MENSWQWLGLKYSSQTMEAAHSFCFHVFSVATPFCFLPIFTYCRGGWRLPRNFSELDKFTLLQYQNWHSQCTNATIVVGTRDMRQQLELSTARCLSNWPGDMHISVAGNLVVAKVTIFFPLRVHINSMELLRSNLLLVSSKFPCIYRSSWRW